MSKSDFDIVDLTIFRDERLSLAAVALAILLRSKDAPTLRDMKRPEMSAALGELILAGYVTLSAK